MASSNTWISRRTDGGAACSTVMRPVVWLLLLWMGVMVGELMPETLGGLTRRVTGLEAAGNTYR